MKQIISRIILCLIIIGTILFTIFISFMWENSAKVYAADSEGRDPETTIIGTGERLQRTAFHSLTFGFVIYYPTGVFCAIYAVINSKKGSKHDEQPPTPL